MTVKGAESVLMTRSSSSPLASQMTAPWSWLVSFTAAICVTQVKNVTAISMNILMQ